MLIEGCWYKRHPLDLCVCVWNFIEHAMPVHVFTVLETAKPSNLMLLHNSLEK